MTGPVVPAVRCSSCSKWADTAHLLPWVTRPARVEFACPDHDPGGYTIPLDAWGLPAGPDMWAHIAGKRDGLRAIAALARALADQQDRRHAEQGEFDARDTHTLQFISGAELIDQSEARERAFQTATSQDREPQA